jgi:hypothetical protein
VDIRLQFLEHNSFCAQGIADSDDNLSEYDYFRVGKLSLISGNSDVLKGLY